MKNKPPSPDSVNRVGDGAPPPSGRAQLRSFLLGGLLPVIAFTVIEEKWGTLAGTVAGMIFGTGEILYEKITLRKVSGITWMGNALILILGGVSLFSSEGVWFKLQPAIMEAVFAAILIGSWVIRKPFLLAMMEKQGALGAGKIAPQIYPLFARAMSGLTLRTGLFFLAHAALATWAALRWSTSAWAFLKGIGFTVSLFVYFGAESLLLRKRLTARK